MLWQHQYHSIVRSLVSHYTGQVRESRNGKTTSMFFSEIRIDKNEFPLLYSRKLYYKGILGELAAMLKGANTVKQFKDFGCNYWDKFADAEGNLELDYGTAWRNFNGVDQLADLIEGLKVDPYSRRHLITGWRPDRLKQLSLPCCHMMYQWYVNNDGTLDMLWYQRSVDVMVGMPSDIFFAAIWNMLVAQTVGLKPGTIHMVFGDTHVYHNHMVDAGQLLISYEVEKASRRNARLDRTEWPESSIVLDPSATVFNFTPDMVTVVNYNPTKVIKFALNV